MADYLWPLLIRYYDALLQFCGRIELDTQNHLFGLDSDGGSAS